MSKTIKTPKEIVNALNEAMRESNELDGDCRRCQVRRITRITEEEAEQLGRNWNVDLVNDECIGECMGVLEVIARDLGGRYDAIWP